MESFLAFNPSEDLLASASYYGVVDLWNLETGENASQLGVGQRVYFTPDGRYLISYGDGALRVWGLP
jgi:WD40 repeat protein